MIDLLLHHAAPARPGRYLRVEICDNLYGEYSLLREAGRPGRAPGRLCVAWYSNLREACLAAETLRQKAQHRGYRLTAAHPEMGLEAGLDRALEPQPATERRA